MDEMRIKGNPVVQIKGNTGVQDVLPKKFKTSDLYFAAYLMTAGCNLTGTSKVQEDGTPPRVVFIFEQTPEMRELKLEYFNRKSKIEALSFVDSIRGLKAIVHSQNDDES